MSSRSSHPSELGTATASRSPPVNRAESAAPVSFRQNASAAVMSSVVPSTPSPATVDAVEASGAPPGFLASVKVKGLPPAPPLHQPVPQAQGARCARARRQRLRAVQVRVQHGVGGVADVLGRDGVLGGGCGGGGGGGVVESVHVVGCWGVVGWTGVGLGRILISPSLHMFAISRLALLALLIAPRASASTSSSQYEKEKRQHGCQRKDPDPGLLHAARPPKPLLSDLSNKDPKYISSMQDFKSAGYQGRPTEYDHNMDLKNVPADFGDRALPAATTYCAGTSSSENNTSAGNSDPVFGTPLPLNPGRVVDSLNTGEAGYADKDRRVATGLMERHDRDPNKFYPPEIRPIVDKRVRSSLAGAPFDTPTTASRARSAASDRSSFCVTMIFVIVVLVVAIVVIAKIINSCAPAYDDPDLVDV